MSCEQVSCEQVAQTGDTHHVFCLLSVSLCFLLCAGLGGLLQRANVVCQYLLSEHSGHLGLRGQVTGRFREGLGWNKWLSFFVLNDSQKK